MTRVTNFGRKRTYLEAGFHHGQPPQECDDDHEDDLRTATSNPTSTSDPKAKHTPSSQSTKSQEGEGSLTLAEPPKKKKKRKHSMESQSGITAHGHEDETPTNDANASSSSHTKQGKKSDRKKKTVSTSESRRLKRINQKLSETTCFACRQKGHAAKDCPKTTNLNAQDNNTGQKVGICYRCGSKNHRLSRCRKPNDPTDPFPFASCFVCDGKGHLASGCPQNKRKGIYPNGGCCKLCGENTHLARDCTIRQHANDLSMVVGSAREAGADEDDFHTLKRTTVELDLAEKRVEKAKKMLEVKKGVFSGVVVRMDKVPLPSVKKKVVMFK